MVSELGLKLGDVQDTLKEMDYFLEGKWTWGILWCKGRVLERLSKKLQKQGVRHLLTQVVTTLVSHLLSLLEQLKSVVHPWPCVYVPLVPGHHLSLLSVHPRCTPFPERGRSPPSLRVIPPVLLLYPGVTVFFCLRVVPLTVLLLPVEPLYLRPCPLDVLTALQRLLYQLD